MEDGIEALLAEAPRIQPGRGYRGARHRSVIYSFYEMLSGKTGNYPHKEAQSV